MTTVLFILLVSAVLVAGGLFLFSSTKEEELHPKNDGNRGIVLEPKLSEEDLKAFSRQHKLVSNPHPFITSLVLIGLVVVALPFMWNTFFKGKGLFPTTNRMLSEGMSQEQYQEICVETLKPAMEEAFMTMLTGAFTGAEDPGAAMEQRFEEIAAQFNLPSFEALIALCSEADTRLNPDPDDRIFKQKTGPAADSEPLVRSIP